MPPLQWTPPPRRKSKAPIVLALLGTAFFSWLIGVFMGAAGVALDAETTAAEQTTVTVTADGKASTVTRTIRAKAPAAQPPAAGSAGSAAINEDGTFLVGSDIKAGSYRAKGGDLCYWARLKDLEGGLDSIIDNHLGGGQALVTIKSSDKAFETANCGAWTKIG